MYINLLLTATIQMSAPSDVEVAIQKELTARPQSGVQDIYKLLHQSVFGPGHIIPNEDTARNYLLTEIAALGPASAGEPMYEELGRGIVRINLRPFRDASGSTEAMLKAMIETANSNSGTKEEMEKAVSEACAFLKKLEKNELAESLKSLAETHAPNGYPALRHSEAYREAYWPAYRIVDKVHLKSLVK